MILSETKLKKSNCPLCEKEFDNVYKMSAHKGHCLAKLNGFKRKRHPNQSWNKGKIILTNEELFVDFSIHSTHKIKKAILNRKIFNYECSQCKIFEWNGKKLSLELDHINGNNQDNRLENLRFLCPNCHSQTDNWRGRNKNSGQISVSDDELMNALRVHKNIRQSLISVGLAAKGSNYNRCKILIERINK